MRLDNIDLRDICTAPTVPPRNGDGEEELDNEDTIFFADEGAALKKIRFFELARNVIETYKPTWLGGTHQSVKEAIQQIKSADISDSTVDFDVAEEREHLIRGETLSTLFGKISKWFHDLKDSAFLPTKNNVTTTEPGVGVLDAHQGKVLQDQINRVNKLFDYDVTDKLTIANPGTYVLDAAAGHELDGLISTLKTEVNAFRNKSIANNFTTAEAGLNVLDAYRGRMLDARNDYAYIKYDNGDYHVSSSKNTPTLVAGATISIGKGESSLYFSTVTHRITWDGTSGESQPITEETFEQLLKFNSGKAGSGKPYLVICQAYFNYNSNNNDNTQAILRMGSVSMPSSEINASVPGGVTCRGKMGYDVNSISRISDKFDANNVYGMFIQNNGVSSLRDGKIFIFPLFY